MDCRIATPRVETPARTPHPALSGIFFRPHRSLRRFARKPGATKKLTQAIDNELTQANNPSHRCTQRSDGPHGIDRVSPRSFTVQRRCCSPHLRGVRPAQAPAGMGRCSALAVLPGHSPPKRGTRAKRMRHTPAPRRERQGNKHHAESPRRRAHATHIGRQTRPTIRPRRAAGAITNRECAGDARGMEATGATDFLGRTRKGQAAAMKNSARSCAGIASGPYL